MAHLEQATPVEAETPVVEAETPATNGAPADTETEMAAADAEATPAAAEGTEAAPAAVAEGADAQVNGVKSAPADPLSYPPHGTEVINPSHLCCCSFLFVLLFFGEGERLCTTRP